MTEESAKQMTWHKKGVRYNPDKLVHPSDGQSWKYFDEIFSDKVAESRNVRVALATTLWNGGCPIHLLARVCYTTQHFTRCSLSTTEHILIIDHS